MHTWSGRANALATLALSMLAVLCLATSLSELVHRSHPSIALELKSVDRFAPFHGNDQGYLAMALKADLTSCFSWNTRLLFFYVQAEFETPRNKRSQVILWDKVVERKEDAVMDIPLLRNRMDYPLVDQGQNLRGREVNLTVEWNVMPLVGYLYRESRTFPIEMPEDYIVDKW